MSRLQELPFSTMDEFSRFLADSGDKVLAYVTDLKTYDLEAYMRDPYRYFMDPAAVIGTYQSYMLGAIAEYNDDGYEYEMEDDDEEVDQSESR